MPGQRVLQQLPADTSAAHVRIDEQRFHVRAVDQHEAQWPILRIDRNGHRRLRQEAGDFGIDGLPVFGAEEVVGGVDGTAPEVDEGGAVIGARGTEGGHGFTKVLAEGLSMRPAAWLQRARCLDPLSRAMAPPIPAPPARPRAYNAAPAAILALQTCENRHDRCPGCTGARRR